MFIDKLRWIETRNKPEKLTKYEEKEGRHLTKEKPVKLYDYYVCDYCGKEIKIEDKWENQTGGVVKIPQSLSNYRSVFNLALHNDCLKSVIKEFENLRRKSNEKN